MKNPFTYFLLICAFISSCCYLPLIDCGPRTTQLNTTQVQSDPILDNFELDLEVSKMIGRKKESPSNLQIRIKAISIDDDFSLILDQAEVKIGNTVITENLSCMKFETGRIEDKYFEIHYLDVLDYDSIKQGQISIRNLLLNQRKEIKSFNIKFKILE